MGKRKKSSRGPVGPKKRDPLPTAFKCVFCSHDTGVTVKLDRKTNIGTLSCKSCGQTFQSPINGLSAPVDVYAEWIDACDALAHDTAAAAGAHVSSGSGLDRGAPPSSRGPGGGARAGLAPGEKYTAEDDGFIDDDDADAEADYEEDED